MQNRTYKAESEKDEILDATSDEFLKGLERADSDLPFPVETVSVTEECRLVIQTDPRSAGADRFRLVQMRLRHLQASKKLRNLLITSPTPGDGKSTVAINLATALAEKGKRAVLLLEADVYRPSLLKKLGLSPWAGLTECLDNKSDPMLAIRRVDPMGFYILPGGTPTPGGNFLQSTLTPQFFEGLATTFKWILVDSPPTTPMAEILALKVLTDATLLVARAGETPREGIESAIQTLGRDHIIGIVLNGMEGLEKVYSKYYGYVQPNDGSKGTRFNGK